MKSPWSAMMLAALVCGVAAFAAGAPEEEMEFQGAPLFHIAAGPAEGLPVLLLHGGAFDSSTWQRLETIQVLADAGYRVFAVDVFWDEEAIVAKGNMHALSFAIAHGHPAAFY